MHTWNRKDKKKGHVTCPFKLQINFVLHFLPEKNYAIYDKRV